jgi:signal transduction histidine kinase
MVSISLISDAQPLKRLNSFAYNLNEGLLESHVIDMNFDEAGIMWLSFETGLQRYDGHNFIGIPIQQGLPENKSITFLRSKNGLLWMFHAKGISVYNGLTNRFALVLDLAANRDSIHIFLLNEDVNIIYFYSTDGMVTGIDENTLAIVSRNKFPFASNSPDPSLIFRTSGPPLNHEVLICFDGLNLIKWDLKKGVVAIICHLDKSKPVVAGRFYPLNGNECLYFVNGHLEQFNMQTKTYTPISKNTIDRFGPEMASFNQENNGLVLESLDNELFEFNMEIKKPVARLVNFQNQPFSHFPIQSIRLDDFGNIYLLTRNEGFVKLLASTYSISYYGTTQKESNFITSLEVDKKNNRVLAGALNSGLLVFDTLQRLIKHITSIGSLQAQGPLTISGIVHTKENEYLLFPRFNKFCVLWDAITGKMKKVQVKLETMDPNHLIGSTTIAYYNSKIKLDKTKELVAVDENIYEVNIAGGPSVRVFRWPNRFKGLFLFQNHILTGVGDNLYFLDRKDYTVLKQVHIPDCGEIRCVIAHNDFIYAGCNRGLFKLNNEGKIISSFTKANGMTDDYVYAVAIDNNENIWCSTNKGLIRIGSDKSLLHLKKEDGLQENEFNTDMVAQSEDGELFFGGVNGINSFYPEDIFSMKDAPKTILTDIRINDEEVFKDSATWIMKKISLPYTSNNLYFEFTALGKRNPEQYLYQYKMSNFDKSWIQNGEIRNARYVLQPGKYIFRLYAGDVFTENPKNLNPIEIIINPPFWQTWWFRLTAVFALIGIVSLAVWQYNRREFARKVRELQLQYEIQHERERISRDLHDNLGAYAAAIAANVSKVKEELKAPKMIDELQINSRAIVTQLNDTIWALNREAILLTSISDRFKVFLQKIQPSYPRITMAVEENISTDINLSPANALHLFRILQEAVNNAARHSNCSHIIFSVESHSICLVCIADDGDGIKDEKKMNTGYGLKNMKLRATEAGWDIKWESQLPHGTKCVIRIKGDGRRTIN